jgi:hypothetical protein
MEFGLDVWHLRQYRCKLLQTPALRTFSQVLDRHEGSHVLGDRCSAELLKGGPILLG